MQEEAGSDSFPPPEQTSRPAWAASGDRPDLVPLPLQPAEPDSSRHSDMSDARPGPAARAGARPSTRQEAARPPTPMLRDAVAPLRQSPPPRPQRRRQQQEEQQPRPPRPQASRLPTISSHRSQPSQGVSKHELSCVAG